MRGERSFATKEGALEFHAGLMATIQKEGGADELLELINKAGDADHRRWQRHNFGQG